MSDLNSLQNELGFVFKDPSLLEQALTHRSFINERNLPRHKSNERLEYLGDAVIGLVTAEGLFELFPVADEGELTRYRANLVRKETLAEISASLGLGEHLILGRGEEMSGGRGRPSNLASVLEAVVGAAYLEAGYEATRSLVVRVFQGRLEAIGGRDLFRDCKSELQHKALEKWQQIPVYRLIEEAGPDHAKEFTVEVVVNGDVAGAGKGRSKQAAEMEAARMALDHLGE